MKNIYIDISLIFFITASTFANAQTCSEIQQRWNNSTDTSRPVLSNHQQLCIPELRTQAANRINGGGFSNRNCGAIADRVEGYMDGGEPRRADAFGGYGECASSFRNSSRSQIYNQVQRGGDGYHLVWGGTRSDGTGHFANLVNIGGEVYMVDFYNSPPSFYSGRLNILNALNQYSNYIYSENFQGRPDIDTTCPSDNQSRKSITPESCGKACDTDENPEAECVEDDDPSEKPEFPDDSNLDCNACKNSWEALLKMSIRFAKTASENGMAGGQTSEYWNQKKEEYLRKIEECCHRQQNSKL